MPLARIGRIGQKALDRCSGFALGSALGALGTSLAGTLLLAGSVPWGCKNHTHTHTTMSGAKRPLGGIGSYIDRPASEALPSASFDSDFDDSDDDAPKAPPAKRPKADTSTSTPASQKRTSRLQACGRKGLDRAIVAARDNGPDVHVTVLSLSIRHQDKLDADELIVLAQRDGASYDLCPPHDPNQQELGETEFMGLFHSGPPDRGDPGVGDKIVDLLLSSDTHHVVVMDPSAKGDNFARLAACVGALRYQHVVNQAAGKALYAALAKPKDKCWKEALKCAAKCRTGWALREKMREHYVDHL